MLGDYLEYWFENIFSPRIETTTRMVGAYTLYNLILPSMEADIKLRYVSVEYFRCSTGTCRENLSFSGK